MLYAHLHYTVISAPSWQKAQSLIANTKQTVATASDAHRSSRAHCALDI